MEQIARDWNVPASGAGFVTRFKVDAAYLSKFTEECVGARMHRELWVPAEELEEFNRHIVGLIEVIAAYEAIPTNQRNPQAGLRGPLA